LINDVTDVGWLYSIKRFLKETKKGVETKILGVLLYHRGLSYCDISKILGLIDLVFFRKYFSMFKT